MDAVLLAIASSVASQAVNTFASSAALAEIQRLVRLKFSHDPEREAVLHGAESGEVSVEELAQSIARLCGSDAEFRAQLAEAVGQPIVVVDALDEAPSAVRFHHDFPSGYRLIDHGDLHCGAVGTSLHEGKDLGGLLWDGGQSEEVTAPQIFPAPGHANQHFVEHFVKGHRSQLRRQMEVPRQLPDTVDVSTWPTRQLHVLESWAAGPQSPTPLVISGPSAVGATGIAVRWAQQIRHQFPDGDLYIDLHGSGPAQPAEPTDILAQLFEAFGLDQEDLPPRRKARAIWFRAMFKGRRMLIVFDDAASSEQILDLIPDVTSNLVIIASRDRLDVDAFGPDAAQIDFGVEVEESSPSQPLEEQLPATAVPAGPGIDQGAVIVATSDRESGTGLTDAVAQFLAACGEEVQGVEETEVSYRAFQS
jgi:hypothetical protein